MGFQGVDWYDAPYNTGGEGASRPIAIVVAAAVEAAARAATIGTNVATGNPTKRSTILGSGGECRQGRWAAVRPHLVLTGPGMSKRGMHTTLASGSAVASWRWAVAALGCRLGALDLVALALAALALATSAAVALAT